MNITFDIELTLYTPNATGYVVPRHFVTFVISSPYYIVYFVVSSPYYIAYFVVSSPYYIGYFVRFRTNHNVGCTYH